MFLILFVSSVCVVSLFLLVTLFLVFFFCLIDDFNDKVNFFFCLFVFCGVFFGGGGVT